MCIIFQQQSGAIKKLTHLATYSGRLTVPPLCLDWYAKKPQYNIIVNP